MRLAIDGQLLQTGEEASLIAEDGGVVVVGMASFPIGEDDGFGAELADSQRKAELVLASGLNVRIGDAQRLAVAYAEQLCSLGGFPGAGFRSAARAHLTRRQIQDAGLVAALRHLEERAAAGQLDVVRVGGDSEQVQYHPRSPVRMCR